MLTYDQVLAAARRIANLPADVFDALTLLWMPATMPYLPVSVHESFLGEQAVGLKVEYHVGHHAIWLRLHDTETAKGWFPWQLTRSPISGSPILAVVGSPVVDDVVTMFTLWVRRGGAGVPPGEGAA